MFRQINEFRRQDSGSAANFHTGMIKGLAYSKATNTIVTGSWDNTAKLFDTEGYAKADITSHPKRMYVIENRIW